MQHHVKHLEFPPRGYEPESREFESSGCAIFNLYVHLRRKSKYTPQFEYELHGVLNRI
jgi:hypothetical protein